MISSAEYIRTHYGSKMTEEQWKKYATETFTGFDTDETMCRLSCMNLMLHSVTNPQLNKQDSVSKDYMVKDTYDLVLANPPFKGTLNKENISESLSAITSTTKTELLFVALFIRLLRVGGRCACIVPDGVLFGSSKIKIYVKNCWKINTWKVLFPCHPVYLSRMQGCLPPF